MARNFRDLSEAEILALAISLEEADGRIYADFADGLRESYPASAAVFDEMQKEEDGHRARLLDMYRAKFGEHIPLIRREDVKGFVQRTPVWLTRPLGLKVVRQQAEIMELETRRFYERAIDKITDASIRKLLGDLAATEREHYARAGELEKQYLTAQAHAIRGRRRAAPLRPADHPARPGRTHGRLGLDAGAALRGRVRHAQLARRLRRRSGRLGRRGHLDGLRGSPVGRRVDDRARAPAASAESSAA